MKLGWLGLVLLGSTTACASTFVTQTVEVNPNVITFHDDLDFKLLDTAIQRQIDAYDSTVKLSGKVQFGSSVYQKSILRDSLVLFQEVARETRECFAESKRGDCFEKFNRAIQTRFKVYRPKSGETKFTAYYSPDFEGSLTPSGPYTVPLYSAPTDETLKQSTREQIIYEGVLAGKGLECAYIDADLFQLYSLHIEGGGRVRLHDADGNVTSKYITYDGKNSLPLRFFSKLMVEHGYLNANQVSYDEQHRYFLEHPEIQRKLIAESPSYVYFKLSDEEPLGINSIPLTENRSLAFDPKYFPVSGILNFIKVNVNGKDVTRFMLGQDVGGAIKGSARADLYFGYGEEARIAAESLKSTGGQYFLIKKISR